MRVKRPGTEDFDDLKREKLSQIIDRHLPRPVGYIDEDEWGMGDDVSLVITAATEKASHYHLWNPDEQNARITALEEHLQGVRTALEDLNSKVLDEFFDSSEGDEGTSPVEDFERAAERLLGRVPAARTFANIGSVAGSCDWTAAAVADACTMIYWRRVGAPPASVTGNANALPRFGRFTQDIFNELGIRLSVRRAMELIPMAVRGGR